MGRGPLAGPVVAACVYIPVEKSGLGFVDKIRDSKTLSEKMLLSLYEEITAHFIWGIAEISPSVIDEINILQASLKAMRLALEKTGQDYAHALVDGNKCPDLPCAATPVVKGDGKSTSIAAASILAKVTRDRIMKNLHQTHPHYGWDRNVGYPTAEHLQAIDTYGLTDHHRKSFAPVRNYLTYGTVSRQMRLAV